MLSREQRREERGSDFWKKELDFRKKKERKIREKKGGRFLSEKQEEKKERVDLSFGSLIS